MKTAVSIPDDVFAEAERLASRLQISRSKLYARALAEFVARHDDDSLTLQVNNVIQGLIESGESVNDNRSFLKAAAQRILPHSEW